MTRSPAWAALALALLLAAPLAQAAPALHAVAPQPGEVVRTATPRLVFGYASDAPLDPNGIVLKVDGAEVAADAIGVNATAISYAVPSILRLREGNHTAELHVVDGKAAAADLAVHFSVNLTIPPPPPKPLDVGLIVVLTAGGLALVAGAAGGGYYYLRRTRNFTLRKHFLRHPEQLRYISLYIPSGIAVVLTLGGLFAVARMAHPPRFATEQVLVVGASLALGPFGLSTLRSTLRTRACERAFAQFLFELADAVRGGINPVKAVQELAKTSEGILKRPMQQAADALRLGRPMDEALRLMTADMGSPLVSRYAALVGEASSMGGSVAGVLQRAAKDMDDLVKIRGERRRALRTPMFTMYMAFGVMAVMVLQIVSFAPNIGDLDLSALGAGGGAAPIARMPLALLQQRFFHLLLMNAAGAGLLIGSFTEGKVRNGILHAIVMAGVAAMVYPLAM
jgi:archaellum biogenesis protein FlaJ (TadC family)